VEHCLNLKKKRGFFKNRGFSFGRICQRKVGGLLERVEIDIPKLTFRKKYIYNKKESPAKQ